MKQVQVYDAGRNQVWAGEVGPSQFALFHVNAKTGRYTNAYGNRFASHWDRTCLVFESLEEAEAYAARKVREVPTLACRIFDPAVGLEEPVKIVRNEEFERGPTAPMIRRRAVWGALLLVVSFVSFGIEWYYEWALYLGLLIGSKTLVVGIGLLVESFCQHVRLRADARQGKGAVEVTT